MLSSNDRGLRVGIKDCFRIESNGTDLARIVDSHVLMVLSRGSQAPKEGKALH